jgi:NAD(P)-dependent dehydrogenase (short-subunit alcohol dehydrogenase family)
MTPLAVISGANRGIGREVTRQLAQRGYTTILGSRNLAAGERVAADFRAEGSDVLARQLDVTESSSIQRIADELETSHGYLEVLVNNAAIHYDTWQQASNADLDVVAEALETNLLGAWRMALAFIPLLRRSHRGRLVNVSSEGASLTSMGGGIPAYRVSKAGLHALTRMLAAELRPDGILVNAVCPGWVATDMGGPGGRPVAEGAASIVWAVDLPNDGPTGGFFRDGHPLPW